VGIGCPSTLIETLQELTQSNVELDIALPVFTSNVAQLLRLAKKGCLKQGFDADMLVLDDGYNIVDVMARGRWHVRNSSPIIMGKYENTQ
jgi:beta-aspartyl-dipeptidase (metallo-type)